MGITSFAMATRPAIRAVTFAGIAGLASALLTGCGLNGTTAGSLSSSSSSSLAPKAKFQGSVFGGQQRVSGATIQLYTVGTTGMGSAAAPLIASPGTTNSSGQFSITGTYSCTSATQVYIVATGGDPGGGK